MAAIPKAPKSAMAKEDADNFQGTYFLEGFDISDDDLEKKPRPPKSAFNAPMKYQSDAEEE